MIDYEYVFRKILRHLDDNDGSIPSTGSGTNSPQVTEFILKLLNT